MKTSIDPFEVLQKFKPNQYDMLILDVRMPKMDGFTLYEEIRKKDENVRVCFLTAYDIQNEESFRKRFPSIDSKCCLKKPISIMMLTKIIKGELGLP